jgi:hypothetical protein
MVAGMGMLTFAPVMNMCGWLLLKPTDPASLVTQQLYTTEFLEVIGMLLLDYSYFPDGLFALIVEVGGFAVLCLAALLDATYTFHSDDIFDVSIEIDIRTAFVHWGEATGLTLLALVAVGKYAEQTFFPSSSAGHGQADGNQRPPSPSSVERGVGKAPASGTASGTSSKLSGRAANAGGGATAGGGVGTTGTVSNRVAAATPGRGVASREKRSGSSGSLAVSPSIIGGKSTAEGTTSLGGYYKEKDYDE